MMGLTAQFLIILACFGGVAMILWILEEWRAWHAQPDPSSADGAPPRRTQVLALAEVVAVLKRPRTWGAFGGRLTAYRSRDGRGAGGSLVLGDLVIGVGIDRQSATRAARLAVRPELIVGRQVLSLDVEATLWRLTPWIHVSLIHQLGEMIDG